MSLSKCRKSVITISSKGWSVVAILSMVPRQHLERAGTKQRTHFFPVIIHHLDDDVCATIYSRWRCCVACHRARSLCATHRCLYVFLFVRCCVRFVVVVVDWLPAILGSVCDYGRRRQGSSGTQCQDWSQVVRFVFDVLLAYFGQSNAWWRILSGYQQTFVFVSC